jgi:hypothetical protein
VHVSGVRVWTWRGMKGIWLIKFGNHTGLPAFSAAKPGSTQWESHSHSHSREAKLSVALYIYVGIFPVSFQLGRRHVPLSGAVIQLWIIAKILNATLPFFNLLAFGCSLESLWEKMMGQKTYWFPYFLFFSGAFPRLREVNASTALVGGEARRGEWRCLSWEVS